MPRSSRPKVGRPRGGKSQVVDVEGCPWIFYKPWFQDGKWRCRRRARLDGAETYITLKDAEDLGEALQDVIAMAKAEAEAARQAALPPEKRDPDPEESITMKELWERWTASREGLRAFRPGTLRLHATARGKILAALGETTPAAKVTLANIEAFFVKLNKAPARRKKDEPPRVGRTGRTLLFYRQKLHALFKYGARHEYIPGNVVENFDAPPEWGDDARAAADDTGQALTPEELRTLIDVAGEPFQVDFTPKKLKKKLKKAGRKSKLAKRTPPSHLSLAILVAALSGLRKGNVIGPNGIRWSDLDLTEGEERLTIDRERMKLRAKRMNPRRQLEAFTVPLNAELAEVLREERKRLGRVPRKLDRVIPDILDFKSAWSGVLTRAGLAERRVRFHDIRHSFSSILGGIAPELVVARIMDHSKRKTTTHRYGTRQELAVLREWLNKLPRLRERKSSTSVDRRAASR